MSAEKIPSTTLDHPSINNPSKKAKMTSGFNNFNSTIFSQTIGTTNINSSKDQEIAFIRMQLDKIISHITADSNASKKNAQNALNAIEEIKGELGKKTPKSEILERSLGAIGSIASVASLVDQLRPFLKNML